MRTNTFHYAPPTSCICSGHYRGRGQFPRCLFVLPDTEVGSGPDTTVLQCLFRPDLSGIGRSGSRADTGRNLAKRWRNEHMSLVTLGSPEIAGADQYRDPTASTSTISKSEAIMEAAEVENCPVILTIGQGAINAGGLRHLPDVVRRIAESSRCRWLSCIWTTASATTGSSLA